MEKEYPDGLMVAPPEGGTYLFKEGNWFAKNDGSDLWEILEEIPDDLQDYLDKNQDLEC